MTKRIKNTSLEDLARIMAEGFAETATKADITDMATKSDITRLESRIDGIDNRLDGVETRLGNVEVRLDNVGNRLGKVEDKVDRALYREINRHDNLIHQLAVKTHVKLEY